MHDERSEYFKLAISKVSNVDLRYSPGVVNHHDHRQVQIELLKKKTQLDFQVQTE